MKQWFSRHWASGNERQWSWRDGKQKKWACNCPILPWVSSLWYQEQELKENPRDSGGDGAVSLGRQAQLQFIGQSTRIRRDTQNHRDLRKFSLEYSEETDQHKHLSKLLKTRGSKRLERMVSSAHSVVPIGTVTTSQIGDFHNSWGIRVFGKVLS